jgi:hypothetical protein
VSDDYISNGLSAPEDYPDGTPTYLPFGEDLHGVKGQLKSLPTPYKGYNFRSLLEAQWSEYFDQLAIEWHYEDRGFTLSPFGDCYRPDFFLPGLGYWIEVKPGNPDEEAQRKTYLFNYCLSHEASSEESRERAFVLQGKIPWPYPQKGNIIGYSATAQTKDDLSQRDLCWQQCPSCQQVMIGRIGTMSCRDCIEELGGLFDAALECVEGIPEIEKVFDIVPAAVSGVVNTEYFTSGHKAPALQEAYSAARSVGFDIQQSRRSA